MRQDAVRQMRNRAAKSELKTLVRRVLNSVKEGKLDQADADLRVASKRLDQVAAKGTIHKNSAARKKSRLSAVVKHAKGK